MTQIGKEIVYVTFTSGCYAWVTVYFYEGKTFEECLKLRDRDIDGYFKDGKYFEIGKQG